MVITWSGRLLIEPEEAPPIDMAGPDDMLVEMVGQPVRITTDRNEIITTSSVDYLANNGRVRMIGTDAHPLQIQSPDMGILHGQTDGAPPKPGHRPDHRVRQLASL